MAIRKPTYEELEQEAWKLGEKVYECERVKEGLQESDRRFRAIFDHTFQLIGLLDPDGTILKANTSALAFSGVKESDVLGKPFWETPWWTHSSELQERLREAVKAAASGRFVRFDASHPIPDGTLKYVDFSLQPVKDEADNVVFLIPEGREITDRKLAEDSLRQSENTARALLNAPTETALLLDPEGRILAANAVAARRLGRSDEELVGKPVFDFMPPDVAESRKMRILQVVRSRKPARFEDESHGRFFDHNMYPVLDVLGDVAQVAIFVRDVTDYKQAVARLEERTAELLTVVTKLELINQELEEFAFIASHDLQEPLRKIQVYCDLANERCREHLDIEGQKYLDRITGSAGRMRELLNSLLQYSRISLRPEPFKTIDLVRVARQAANLFEMDFKKSGGRIEIESMPELEADESQILSLFENLIGNALKFCSQEGPQIKIYARSEGRRCEIFVSDNGIGFERQFAELIFKPFERLHGPGEYEGTGMGLTICRKIVQRHKGDIRAESEPGKGSTFIISLPLKQNV